MGGGGSALDHPQGGIYVHARAVACPGRAVSARMRYTGGSTMDQPKHVVVTWKADFEPDRERIRQVIERVSATTTQVGSGEKPGRVFEGDFVDKAIRRPRVA
jgi:hypothetical protein